MTRDDPEMTRALRAEAGLQEAARQPSRMCLRSVCEVSRRRLTWKTAQKMVRAMYSCVAALSAALISPPLSAAAARTAWSAAATSGSVGAARARVPSFIR